MTLQPLIDEADANQSLFPDDFWPWKFASTWLTSKRDSGEELVAPRYVCPRCKDHTCAADPETHVAELHEELEARALPAELEKALREWMDWRSHTGNRISLHEIDLVTVLDKYLKEGEVTQLSLYQPALLYAPGSETSRQAAEAIRPSAPTLRELVERYIREQGTHGATDQELQRQLCVDANTERPRRGELVDAGKVRDSGRTRPTSSGRRATVWVSV